MKLVKSKVKLPYDEMDKEMIEICEFFNTLPGVETKYCCSGHGCLDDMLDNKEVKGSITSYIYFTCNNKK